MLEAEGMLIVIYRYHNQTKLLLLSYSCKGTPNGSGGFVMIDLMVPIFSREVASGLWGLAIFIATSFAGWGPCGLSVWARYGGKQRLKGKGRGVW